MAQPESSAEHSVLVVEDNEHTAYMLEFILRRAGYAVTVAPDGRAAATIIDESSPVDAVVLDLMLPYVSGEDLILKIREQAGWRTIPVLVLSGRILEQDIVNALELGANDYLTKPFRPPELLARLKRMIATREESGPST
ncbi:MAG: response regulator transcription factor [Woeseia sp.]